MDSFEGGRSFSDYEILYSKGEITFTEPLELDRRVVVEYEVAESEGAGKFTGFRMQSEGYNADGKNDVKTKTDSEADTVEEGQSIEDNSVLSWGGVSVNDWGVTYLLDNVISYGRENGEIERGEMEHRLMGFDGALSLWGNTNVKVEAASSTGNKSRDLGRYAKKEFTIADTSASDMNPMGPYYLDDDKLPVKEGSEEVRLNGELLVRDEDYTLGTDYGSLRLKNEELNLSSLDVIEVEYRYIAEEDQLLGQEDEKNGVAGLVSIDNEIKGIKHHYSTERRSADFMQVGGKSSSQLETEAQDISWSGAGGLSLGWGRTRNETLQDYVTGLKRIDEGHNFSVDYKTDTLSLAFKTDEKDQYDNQEERGTDSSKQNQSISASYKFNDRYSLSFNDTRNDGTDLRSGAVSTTFSNARNYTLDAEPIEKLKLTYKTGTGETGNASGETARSSEKKDRSISLKYDPSRKWSLQYDNSQNDVSNSSYVASTGAFATDTAITGNTTSKWRVQYKPDKNTTLMYRDNADSQDQVNGRTDKTQKYYDVRRKFGDDIDFQYRKSALVSNRPTQSQNTDVDNFTLRLKRPWFEGTDISLKHNRQNSDTESMSGTATKTGTGSTANTISLSCSPIWEERKLSLEFTDKNSSQETTGQAATSDGEKKWKAEIEIPFIKESYLAVTREQSSKSGRRSTRTELLEISLNGEVIPGISLQFSYSSDKFSDPENPQTNRTDSVMNIVLKGERQWR